MSERAPIGVPAQLWAVVSLAAGAVLAVLAIGLAWRHAVYVLLTLLGLAVAVAGAWWLITERMPRRLLGVVGLALGGALVVVVVGQASPAGDDPVLRLVLLGVLVAAAVGSARAALSSHLHEFDRRRPRSVVVPRRPVLICNPWSGGGKVERFGLVELAESMDVEVVMLDAGLDLEQLARDAVARGADCLGMAGGDGSQALVASIAVEHDLPFVVVSAGTRNHLALDLGLNREDPREGLRAFRDGIERRIDYATVGDRLFVNNVSLGVYATIVQHDGYREAKAETALQLLPDMLGRTEAPFDLEFREPDGNEVDGAFLVQVSNNPYVLGPTPDVAQRRRVDTGALGVVAVTASTGAEAASVVAMSALGQRRRSRHWHEFTCREFEVRSRSGTVAAGVDGEALELEAPLRFRIHPRGLRLLVPEGNLTEAERRRARDVSVRDLLRIARGADPLVASAR
ncbi:MAG: hypothetical protein MUE36_09280 [Acidimicrobiales bacterium]|jgi:diacylglycerol kinase family enzyme|nr:hypothetical protein [Acidimicrobiales bacterium]